MSVLKILILEAVGLQIRPSRKMLILNAGGLQIRPSGVLDVFHKNNEHFSKIFRPISDLFLFLPEMP